MAGLLLEVLDHGVNSVLVNYNDESFSFRESRHVMFDETKFLGTADLAHCMDEEPSDTYTWEEIASSTEEYTSFLLDDDENRYDGYIVE